MTRSHCIECGGPCDVRVTLCRTCFDRQVEERTAPPNPSGLCMCGCGQPAPIATKTNSKLKLKKGYPARYIMGHQAFQRNKVLYEVDAETGCWLWLGVKRKHGYGAKFLNGKLVQAHRYIYELHRGPIPDGLFLDHLCRNPSCVNPDHLEPVTNAENLRRGKGTRLTMQDAREIRELAKTMTRAAIARRYGLSPGYVCAIVNGRKWKEDTDPPTVRDAGACHEMPKGRVRDG